MHDLFFFAFSSLPHFLGWVFFRGPEEEEEDDDDDDEGEKEKKRLMMGE